MLGVDIGSCYIKLVALRRHRGRWHLQACAAHRVADDCADEPGRALPAALALLPLALRRKLPAVGFALPASALSVRLLDLPAGLAPDELDLAVRIECEQALSAADEPVSFDYRRCGERFLSVACRQSLLDNMLSVFADAGVKPVLAGADALMIADTLSADAITDEQRLYVDAGGSGVRLLAVRAGEPVYLRSHLLSDSRSTRGNPAAFPLLLRRAIQQYRMFDMLARPEQIVLYGGAAAVAGVREALLQAFDVPVSCINPFTHSDIRDADQNTIHLPDGLDVSAYMLASVLARQELPWQ